jgi:hypothetical protein
MINEQMLEQVRDRIVAHNKKRNGKLTFTVEYGRGETYANNELTVYAHDDYEKSSVLYGRERRMWIGTFGDVIVDGPQIHQDAKDTIEAAGASKITQFMGGSTHVPISQIISHLPDDTDY